MQNRNLTQTKLIAYTVVFLTLFYNLAFFQNTLKIYPFVADNFGFLLSLPFLIISFTIFLLTIFSSKYSTKPLLIIIILFSSLAAYFMNNYGVIVSDDMIRNIMQTNFNESMDLLTIKQIGYFVILGLIPSYFIYKTKINYQTLKTSIFSKLKFIIIALLIFVSVVLLFSKHYTSFIREHKQLRFSINPTYWIYSLGKYTNDIFNSGKAEFKKIGLDAKIVEKNENHQELVIMVVGEAARAANFSLNGYQKQTNPLLEKQNIINLSNIYSCGTSTAHSVPCMFSIYERGDYSYKKGINTENVVDVINKTKKVKILWRDNNSDSKGVALRVDYQNYKTAKNNTICEDGGECRDEGMLIGLDDYIKQHPNQDILIILHQMGNHGPAYYKRYPQKFEKFTPTCKTNQVEKCSQEEIINAYDNAILYTDYFLDKTINFLKKYNNKYETAMIYMSDHGESLGENGIYLHGLPYFIAPKYQKHIGALMWFGDKISKDIDTEQLQKDKDKRYSHDNLFHTLLGLFEVKTKVYDEKMDILKHLED